MENPETRDQECAEVTQLVKLYADTYRETLARARAVDESEMIGELNARFAATAAVGRVIAKAAESILGPCKLLTPEMIYGPE